MSGSPASGPQSAIRGHVFRPHDPGFAAAAHVFNTRFDGVLPHAVARPVDGLDVRDAVRFTVAHNVPVHARSGGHSYAGYSTLTNGVVLDLRRLNAVTFDKPSGLVTVGAGAQLIDVYAGLASHGVTVPGGSCSSVGVAGVALGGGFGLASRHLGLTIDSLHAVNVVTVDGSLRMVNHSSDPDLFWALRGGGGGNFGIVTELVFQTHPVPARTTYFQVRWPWPSADGAIDAWQQWAPHTADKITSILHLNAGGPAAINANGQYLGPAGDIPGLLAPLLSVPGASLSSNHEAPFLAIQLLLANCDGKTVSACHTVNAGPGGTLAREAFNANLTTASAAAPRGSTRRGSSCARTSQAARTRTTSIPRCRTGKTPTTPRTAHAWRASGPRSIPTTTSTSPRPSGADANPHPSGQEVPEVPAANSIPCPPSVRRMPRGTGAIGSPLSTSVARSRSVLLMGPRRR